MKEIELLYPHPALLLGEDRRYLVISDLHIGFEERFSSAGVKVVPSTEKMLDTLKALLSNHKPDQLIILGDVKYSVDAISDAEWGEVPSFLEKVSNMVEITIIPGNHDGGILPLLPRNVRLSDKPTMLIGDTCLLHGHTAPPPEIGLASRVVLGHVHPTYGRRGSALSGQQVWLLLKVRRAAFERGSKEGRLDIYVLPSFNTELSPLGFQAVHGKIIAPLLRRVREDVEDAAILTLNGDVVGRIESLHYTI